MVWSLDANRPDSKYRLLKTFVGTKVFLESWSTVTGCIFTKWCDDVEINHSRFIYECLSGDLRSDCMQRPCVSLRSRALAIG